jgi:hypothetical protein
MLEEHGIFVVDCGPVVEAAGVEPAPLGAKPFGYDRAAPTASIPPSTST